MVRFTPDIIPTMARYRNFGNVRTVGVELDCKADVLPWAYLYANGTWQDLRDTRRMLPDTQVDNPTYNKRIPNVPYLMVIWCRAAQRKPLWWEGTKHPTCSSTLHTYINISTILR